jgi:hypothetical protein
MVDSAHDHICTEIKIENINPGVLTQNQLLMKNQDCIISTITHDRQSTPPDYIYLHHSTV